MNKERLLKLADLIENKETVDQDGKTIAFNMSEYCDEFDKEASTKDEPIDCKTVCCIAGHACFEFASARVLHELLHDNDSPLDWDEAAAELLGLTNKQARYLFCPLEVYVHWEMPFCPAAAECIRHLVETGEIDWNRAIYLMMSNIYNKENDYES